MSTRAMLTTVEAADVLGVHTRTVRKIADTLRYEPAAEPARNGVAPRMFDLACLPPDAQSRWAQMNKVVPMAPAARNPGQMALSLTVPVGPNLSDSDRIEAERRYRAIEPLLARDRFVALWAQHHNSKVEVIDFLAHAHKTARRTIYTWLGAWKQGGLPALVPKDRADKGVPKSFNAATLEFILACAFPKHGAYGKLTIRDIFRAYADERLWRAARIGTELTDDFDRQKYRRYMTTDGCLTAAAALPRPPTPPLKTGSTASPKLPKSWRAMATKPSITRRK